MYWGLLILIVIFMLGYNFFLKNRLSETFTCYPDVYDDRYSNIKSNYINHLEAKKLLARRPKYVNKTIIPMNKDTANTVYFSAYSPSGELIGYLKMAITEKFMGNLIDAGFYEQELFGFTGAFGYHIYELVGFNEEIVEKLVKRAIHQLKEDGNRYYLSILCLDEKLAQVLMNKFKFVLTLKEQSKRFYKNTLYTLVYYK
jgi:hypothetical protein